MNAKPEFKSLAEFMDFFRDEETCVKHYTATRFANGEYCPYCKHTEIYSYRSQQTQGFCGQLFGLIIGISGLLCATYAAISGQPTFGLIIGGSTLVSLVSVFLYSRNAQKRELSAKNQQMMAQSLPMLQPQQNKNNKKKNRNR